MDSAAPKPVTNQTRTEADARAIRPLLTILIFAIIILLNGGIIIWIQSGRADTITDADSGLRNGSRVLAEVAQSNFTAIDKVLAGTAEIVTIKAKAGGIDGAGLLPFLRRQVAEAPAARALLVIGADGISRAATNLPDPLRPLDLSDRSYVQVHRDDPQAGLFISPPIPSRNDGHWIMVLSRRVDTPDGGFAGVVAATIDLERLAGLVGVISPLPSDSALLVTPEGAILARVPDHARSVGQSLAGLPAFERARAEDSGSGALVSPLDGRDRLYAFHRVRSYPVIAVLSRDLDAVLGEWRRQSLALSVFAALSTIVIGILSWSLSRQLERLDHTLAELAKSRRAADSANQAKSSFLANMSHELRTPLNAILGFSDALLVGIPGHACRPRCLEYLGHVQSSGRHLLALINDILDLSKIEAGKAEIDVAPADIAHILAECAALLRPPAEAKAISLETAGLDQPIVHAVDSRRLRQIVLNLLSNAVKFTPVGGRITLSAAQSGRGLSLVIADTGAGMSPEEIQVALTPFGQNAATRRQAEAGTGLGLPLSRRLAELHGGRLDIASRPGHGTTVTVTLPFAALAQNETAAP